MLQQWYGIIVQLTIVSIVVQLHLQDPITESNSNTVPLLQHNWTHKLVGQ